MAEQSVMLPLGTTAPDFALPDLDGAQVTFDDVAGEHGTLVMFLCVHCPFVKHIQAALARLTAEYAERGIGVVGINANSLETHPQDGPEHMREQVSEVGFTFPYLRDDSQEVAKAYRAACTPDFYVFDADRTLVYRGQMDDARPGNDQPVDGADLRAALDALLAGEPVPQDQKPSMGCNVKWAPGNEPVYAGGAA